jgi:hypothetical protein
MDTTYLQSRNFMENLFSGSLEKSIEWIQNNMEPEEVFNQNQLEDWAKENGYVKDSQ